MAIFAQTMLHYSETGHLAGMEAIAAMQIAWSLCRQMVWQFLMYCFHCACIII